MKKRIDSIAGCRKSAVLAAVLAASAFLTACGSKEYLKDIDTSDYVTLGNYIGVEASAAEPVVEDEAVDMDINYYILPSYAYTGRAVEEGDAVNIDYAGYIDGEQFAGGTGSNPSLTIGSGQFIDGFEEGLIGVDAGETVSLELSFPDPYLPNPDLSGVPVVFEVTVKGILPELNDEFVQSLGLEGCTTVQDLWDYVYNIHYEDAVQTYENSIERTLMDTIMADSTFKEPPAEMVERFNQILIDGYSAEAALWGMSLSEYMQNYYGMNEETYNEWLQENALRQAQQYIMLQAIADREGLSATDEQLQEEIARRVEDYGFESEEAYREGTDVETLREQLMRKNVMEFLKENGNITTITITED